MDAQNLYDWYSEMQQYIGWNADDEARVRRCGEMIKSDFEGIVDDFYQRIRRAPDALAVMKGGDPQILRLQATLNSWLNDLFAGPYDRSYVQARWRIGLRHVDLGLEQMYVNAAMSRLRHGLATSLNKHWPAKQAGLAEHLGSLHALLDMELAIIEKAYRDEFTRRDQQVQRMAMLGQVAAGISHELRNPLNVVKTSVYFLTHAEALTAEKTEEHLQRIERQINLASDVITAVSEFAKIGQAKWTELYLHDLLPQWVTDHCHGEGITTHLELQDCGAVVGDSRQLQVVVGNLVRNACDAMPNGGKLEVELTRDDADVVLRVKDTGGGISPEIIDRITDPWFSTKTKGTGLGLAITKAILEKHDARISVASAPEQGTTFSVRFPGEA